MERAQASIGFVAIGRNEGARIERCLRALKAQSDRVIYVDSDSKDDSVATAKRLGVSVIELDHARPFTAARSRNEGFAALIEK